MRISYLLQRTQSTTNHTLTMTSFQAIGTRVMTPIRLPLGLADKANPRDLGLAAKHDLRPLGLVTMSNNFFIILFYKKKLLKLSYFK